MGAGFPHPWNSVLQPRPSLWLFHPLYPAPWGAGGSEPPESPQLAGRAGAPRRASREGVAREALCTQLPRAAGGEPDRSRQSRGGGLGGDSGHDEGRVRFSAETALQPRAQRPMLWFPVLFHGISRKQLPRDQQAHSSADATVTDTPHTHAQPARAPPRTRSAGLAPRSSWSPADLGLKAAPRSWGLKAGAGGRGRRLGTEAGDRGWAGAQAGQAAGP